MEKRQLSQSESYPRHSIKHNHRVSPKTILAAAFALVVAFLLAASVFGLAEKYFTIRRHIQALKKEEVLLQQKKETLTKTNEYLATPEGAEQNLRSKFNLVRPGEEMIIITPSTSNTLVEAPRGPVGRFWDVIRSALGGKKD